MGLPFVGSWLWLGMEEFSELVLCLIQGRVDAGYPDGRQQSEAAGPR